MRDSSRLTRRAALGLTAAVLPLVAATPASAATAIGGERLARDGIQAGDASTLPKKLTARSWLIADHKTGEVLASYRAHQRLAPASTLKMLFADTVLGKFERTRTYRVTDADLADVPSGSSLVGVKPGILYTVHQLWQGVFLRSGNDAVHVLAHMNGGIAATVAQMQAKAKDLQALDTHVVSPDGFDHPGQVSSAYDLTLFARHGLHDDDFSSYCSTRVANFPAGGKKTFQIQNTDRLLSGAYGLRAYPGIIGVKNGYTSHAGNTFTGAATRDGRTLLVTVMHPANGGKRGLQGDRRTARLGLRQREFGPRGGHAGRSAERGRGHREPDAFGCQGGAGSLRERRLVLVGRFLGLAGAGRCGGCGRGARGRRDRAAPAAGGRGGGQVPGTRRELM